MTAGGGSSRLGAGRRGAWTAVVAGVCALGVLEISVLHLIAGAYLPGPVAVASDAVIAVPTVVLLLAMASPLWSGHRVDASGLHLRFGWLAALDVPHDAVRAVRIAKPTTKAPAQTGLDYDEKSETVSFIRSPSSDLVRIELTGPRIARTQGWRRVSARAIVITVDDAETFCAAVESVR